MPSDRALARRMALWIALVVSLTVAVAAPGPEKPLISVGSIQLYVNDLLVLAAVLLGAKDLLWSAGHAEPSLSRFASRLIVAYLAYELLVVIPVALWLQSSSVVTAVRAMGVRFDWLLFPVFLVLFRDRKMRRIAAGVLVAAAVALALWGAYLALTGQGGFYWEPGEGMRYRVLSATAPPFFFWPLALAVSAVVGPWMAFGLFAVAAAGMTLAGFRSAYVALVVASFVGLITSKRLMRVLAWAIPVGLIGVVAYVTMGQRIAEIYGYTLGRMLDFGSSTAVDRFTRWRLAWEFIRSHPLNDYVWTWRRYAIRLSQEYEPHNFLLEIGTNEGIAGYAFYGAMLGTLAWKTWRHLWNDVQVRALACYLVAYVVFSAGNTNWYSYASLPLLVAAVAALVARLDEMHSAEAGANGSS